MKATRDFIFDPSLALYLPLYQLDGASFMSKDKHGHLCTVTGAVWQLFGRYCDGIDDSGSLAAPPVTVIDNWTMEAWLNPANLSQISIVVSNGRDDGVAGDGYAFGVGDGAGAAGNKLQGLLPAVAWLNTGYTFPFANEWYHTIMLRENGTIRFYVNGAQTLNTFTTVPLTPTQFRFGSQTGVRYFNGIIGEIRIYIRPITPLEIQHNYLATKWRYH